VLPSVMVIGDRLRDLREFKGLTQDDIQKRTGLMRPHLSRVENGHTVPSAETLEKWARALNVPLYALFYDGDQPPMARPVERAGLWGSTGKDARLLAKFRRAIARLDDASRALLLQTAREMERNMERKK
jgi:transcriptional regulator with XRE-family HTH domain